MSERPEDHLYRAMLITAGSRFNAAKRLKRHGEFSLWSIAICSICLIAVSLVDGFGVAIPKYLVFTQTLFSILILLISVATSGYRFGERAEKMHECALAINSLARKLEFILGHRSGVELQEEASNVRNDYEEILKAYENNNDSDHRFARYNRFKSEYGLGRGYYIKAFVTYWLFFSHYLILLGFSVLILSMVILLLIAQ